MRIGSVRTHGTVPISACTFPAIQLDPLGLPRPEDTIMPFQAEQTVFWGSPGPNESVQEPVPKTNAEPACENNILLVSCCFHLLTTDRPV